MADMLPLEGITVVELGSSLAAPFCARILGDMGAEILKVEAPGGESARHWGPPNLGDTPAFFQIFNQNKQSLTVDFNDDTEREALIKLILDRADVVLQNLRPGVVTKFGIDGKTLCAISDRLIYCNVTAFGETGDMAMLPGYDPLMQAFGGISHATGSEESGPCRSAAPIIDIGTGMWAAIGIMGALQRRERTGKGGQVAAAMMETGVTWMSHTIANILGGGSDPKRTGLRGGVLAPNGGFTCSDGIIVITCGTNVQFGKLCEILGEPDLIKDPKLTDNTVRLQNADHLEANLNRLFAKDNRANWSAKLNDADIPNAPVQTVSEAMAHPQVAAVNFLQSAPDAEYAIPTLPLQFDGGRLPIRNSAPPVGNANDLLDPYR